MDLISLIENIIGKKAIIDFQPMQPGDVANTHADISCSKEKLNFFPVTSITDGIPKFIEWYKKYKKL